MQDVHSLLVFRSAAKLSLVHSFLLRGGGFRRFFKAIFAQNPRHRRGFLALMPSSHSTRRENARRSFAPRSCGTIAHSLIFAPRRRLPPPLLSARHFSLKTRGIDAGFLHLCLPLTLRVAKILLRVPWGMLLPPPSLRAFLPRELTPPKMLSVGAPELTPQNIRFAGTPDSAVENAVIRMRCKEKASFSRGAYLVVRNPQFCPTENAFGGDPVLYPTKNPADFTRGPRFY